MAPSSDDPVLFPESAGSPEGVVVINSRCRVQEREGYRVVSVCGLPLTHFAAGDRVGEAYAMVSLVDLGWAQQVEVARAFGCAVRTVRRHQGRFEEGGLAALGRPPGFPRGRPRVSESRQDAVNRWKTEGASNREIARRLGIDESKSSPTPPGQAQRTEVAGRSAPGVQFLRSRGRVTVPGSSRAARVARIR